MGDSIFAVSFDNYLMKERGVPVTQDSPSLFGSLNVIGFFFGKQVLMFISELLLEGMILLGRVEILLIEELGLNLGEKIAVPGLFLSPFSQVSAKDELVPGDVLFLPVNIQESSVTENTKKFGNKNEIDFLRGLEIYKDRAIIVLNKPPGMPVQGGVGIKNSIDILAPMFEDGSSEAPRLVHRLDRDCSGVLVLGRTQLSASIMHAIFREKTAGALGDGTQQVLQRKYVALVIGRPRHPKGLLSAPLAKVVLQDGRSERLTVCAGSNTASVQDALTEYRVIESCPQGYTWLELFPRTGRKHQLRVHCAEVLGTPIVGDYKYGRQAHQNWAPLPMPQTIDEEMLKKRKLPFGLPLGGGSVAEQQPQLHLHCKQMILPDISAAMQQLQSSDSDHDFSDLEKLSFVAPLPLHMRLSWKILMSIGK